ncbi:MAG: hypothetical protein WBR13_01100 [Allosphingosinicella sp.]
MNQSAKPAPRSRLFLWAGAFGVAVAIVGFAKTFFYPLITGTFTAHPLVYIHGVFLFAWVAFFVAQSLLVQRKKLRLHKKMGWAGGAIAAGVVLSTLAIATFASRRTASGGAPVQANGELLVVMIEMTMFSALIAWALLVRKRPEIHKRLMLLALIGSLGPAWFRFRHYFPEIGNPLFFYSVLLADSLILIAAVSDLMRNGRVHWVYPVVGGAMFTIHLFEVFGFEWPAFQSLANLLAGPIV